MTDSGKVVDFDNPPVMEVVVGATFAPLRRLQTAHIGRLWQLWEHEFPLCQDVPRLPPLVEDLDGAGDLAVLLANYPDLPRVWLKSADDRTIIQLQRDRFHVNRRRLAANEEYEGFGSAYRRFAGLWSEFLGFTEAIVDEAVSVTQFELTYVNVIGPTAVCDTLPGLGSVFPDLAWRPGAHPQTGPAESVEWTNSFRLRDGSGRLRASVSARSATDNNPVTITCELTARGKPQATTAEATADWFQLARAAIDHGFVELTSERMQREIWGRNLQ